jgi:hypothetical protein
MHDGELYVWNTLGKYYETKYNGDVNKMIEIINSDKTLYEHP